MEAGMKRRQDGTMKRSTQGQVFRGCFILPYHLYRDYFPLLALTTYKRAMEKETAAAA